MSFLAKRQSRSAIRPGPGADILHHAEEVFPLRYVRADSACFWVDPLKEREWFEQRLNHQS